MASLLDLESTLETISIEELVEKEGGPCTQIVRYLDLLLESSSELERTILDKRLFFESPRTLAEIGDEAGLTSERVRQVEKRIVKKLESEVLPKVDRVAALVRPLLADCLPKTELQREVEQLFPDPSRPGSPIARRIFLSRLGYTVANEVCLNDEALEVVDTLETTAREIADPVGLISEEELQKSLPGPKWLTHWPVLITITSLRRVGRLGHLALRDTAKARAKAAVIELGRVATKEEIADTASIEVERIGSLLSAVPGVQRADKLRWGLTDWIDDVYEGIPAEITQRIEEGGGVAVVDHLLEEIPRLFNVEESSVRAYLATPQFDVRDGQVRLATGSQFVYRDLEDVIDGRDEEGNAIWEFAVAERYFRGFSVVGFPPELARELGCGPNDRTVVPILEPESCGQLSVNWRLSATSGASIGQLSTALEKLDVSDGDTALLVLLENGVAMRRGRALSQEPADSEEILEQLKRRKKWL